jgi:hypothetical protein
VLVWAAEVDCVPSPLKSTQLSGAAESGAAAELRSALFEELVQAAHDGDRSRFDACFDACFARLYAVAWRATQDQRRAEAMTEELMLELVRRPR